MNRPNIADYFPADTSIKDLHQKLCLAPELYRYICALDDYIDEIEEEGKKEPSMPDQSEIYPLKS